MNAKTRGILDEDARRREADARAWQRARDERQRRRALAREAKPLTHRPFASLYEKIWR